MNADWDRVKELVERRKREAEERRIFSKAASIAWRLGEAVGIRGGTEYRFRRGGLSIYFKRAGWSIREVIIWFKNVKVFHSVSPDIYVYRPDVEGWIELIDGIYHNEVVPIIEREKVENFRKEVEEIRRKWGIRVEEVMK